MELRDLIPHLLLMLVGSLATSVGVGQLARTQRGRAQLAHLGGGMFTGLVIIVVGVAGTGIYLFVRRLLSQVGEVDLAATPSSMLLFGLLVGLPFCLPSVFMSWSESRSRGKEARTAPATKAERREFAESLVRQIRDVSDKRTEVTARVGGDGERVLFLDGDLSSEQGEKLVAALRVEMKDLGFKRVEGSGPGGAWWTRV